MSDETHLKFEPMEHDFIANSVEFIKMMLVIYKAHFTPRYQIVVISNSWKLFLFPSLADFNLCIWLPSKRICLVYFVCIFIANANELVGKSCVIKFYFQRTRNHARNAMLLSREEWRWRANARRKERSQQAKRFDDNASCASLGSSFSHNRKLRFIAEIYIFTATIFWLIISLQAS